MSWAVRHTYDVTIAPRARWTLRVRKEVPNVAGRIQIVTRWLCFQLVHTITFEQVSR